MAGGFDGVPPECPEGLSTRSTRYPLTKNEFLRRSQAARDINKEEFNNKSPSRTHERTVYNVRIKKAIIELTRGCDWHEHHIKSMTQRPHVADRGIAY